MCASMTEYGQRDRADTINRGGNSRSLWLGLLLVFVFTAVSGLLFAQSNREEYELVKNYILPAHAEQASELTQEGEVWLKDGKPFTGIAIDRFTDGRLARMLTLRKGLQHGNTYLWYPDGSPQMSATYRKGQLQGRFLGWYQSGGIIYDMVINRNGYAGDYIEDDGSRAVDDSSDSEPEGNENDFEKE